MRRVVPFVVTAVMLSACGTAPPQLVDPGLAREVDDASTTTALVADRTVIRVGVDGTWSGDPADAGPADLTGRILADLLYEGLTGLDPDGNPVPALAESWTVSGDRLTWAFTVSPDAVDSAGEAITARDVMQSLDRVAARGPNNLSAPALDAITGWNDRMYGRAGGVAGITAPAADQVVIRLDTPFEPLLDVLAAPAFGIVVMAEDGIRSTGSYRLDEGAGVLEPAGSGSALPNIELVDVERGRGSSSLRAGEVDWVPLAPGTATDDLPGDVVRVPLDVSLGIAIRTDEASVRRALAEALDPVALAGAVGLVPVPRRVAEGPVGDLPAEISIGVPEGPLAVLGELMGAQLEAAGVVADVTVSARADFAGRVVSGSPALVPLVLAGGTWSGAGVAGALVPGDVDDLIAIGSEERAALGTSLEAAPDSSNRELLAEALWQRAIDEGVVVPVGALEILVGVSDAARGVRHRSDGTLDLSAVG